MGARQGPAPDPSFGSICCSAGSGYAQREEPVGNTINALRPGAPSVYSVMLGLLETLRTQVLSGPEPAPFLIALTRGGRTVMAAAGADVARLGYQYGPIDLAFRMSALRTAGGLLLRVEEPTGRTDHVLEQFCRRTPAGALEALPHSWRRAIRSSAASSYHSTSGLIPYGVFHNSDLLNHLIAARPSS